MLHLLGVLLSWAALCPALPVPTAAGRGCPGSSLVLETLDLMETLRAKGVGETPQLNNMMEAGENVTTYLEGFIKVLKSSKERSKERLIAQNLQRLQDASKSCFGRMEQDWEPLEDEDFFSNLEYLLRFLNHNILSKVTTSNAVFKEV